jgi:hypothetical protein
MSVPSIFIVDLIAPMRARVLWNVSRWPSNENRPPAFGAIGELFEVLR